MVDIIVFILILSFLVLIHELGHYLVAKYFKVTVEEFGLGYPPKAATLFKKWGTEFTLNWVPFGGFVKMKGEFSETEEPTTTVPETKTSKKPSTNSGDFNAKPALPRLAIILAGAAVNFLYGILAFSIVFSIMGIPASEALISEVQPESPAAEVGIPTNVKITDVKIGEDYIATPIFPQVSELLREHPGETVVIRTQGPCVVADCETNITEYTVTLRPAEEVTEQQGPLGVTFETRLFYPWYQMPFKGIAYGLEQAVLLGWTILQGLSSMITNLVLKGIVPQDVSGPVGIVHQAQQTKLFQQGVDYVVLFSGLISINLAIMNVLPIPALDGGRALFIVLEKIVGKRRVASVEGYANYAGFALLIVLIVLVTVRDVARIIQP